MVLADGDIIDADMLPQEILGRTKHMLTASFEKGRVSRADMTLEKVEQEHIQRVLEAAGGNRTKAVKILSTSRSTQIEKLKKLK